MVASRGAEIDRFILDGRAGFRLGTIVVFGSIFVLKNLRIQIFTKGDDSSSEAIVEASIPQEVKAFDNGSQGLRYECLTDQQAGKETGDAFIVALGNLKRGLMSQLAGDNEQLPLSLL